MAIEEGAARRDTSGLSVRARIAVVRALHGLGDMLCAVPALTALRRAHPDAHITLIGLPACRWMVERFEALLDALVPFPGFPGIPERPYSPVALERFVAAARAAPFDLAIQMHGSGTVSNAFTTMLGARAAAGLYETTHARPAGRFFPYPRRGPEIHRCLHLTRALGCPSDDDEVVFPVRADDRAALGEHVPLRGLVDGPFVCLHAGARDPARRWPAERFATVGDVLAAQGYRVVLTGTAAERGAADAVAAAMCKPSLNAAGTTSLGVAAALLERAALLVTNDTGISHLAASVGTPSVVVFLASDPERWAPLRRERHRPVVARGLAADRSLDGMRRSNDDIPLAGEVLDEALAVMTGAHDR
ncbi:MAG TPA: glycosyltransferase family 9 protein [Gammaproteobacteria bacterium]